MKKIIIQVISNILKTNVHPDFTELFLEKEGEQLLGKHYKNIIFLIIIFSLTLIAIGFANGSLEYLGKKMNDPFVKFVDIEIPRGKSEKVGSIQYQLNSDSLAKNKYHYNGVYGFNKVFLIFKSKTKKKKSDLYICSGRTIPIDDPLLKNILNKENLIKGRNYYNKKEFGLIVTLEMLHKLHLKENIHYLPYSFSKNTISPLPVVAIVKELPGMNEFAVTPYFYSQRLLSYNDPMNPLFTKDIILYSNSDSVATSNISTLLKKIIKENPVFRHYSPELDVMKNNYTYETGYNFTISFLPKPPNKVRKLMINSLLSNKNIKPYNLLQIFRFNPTANETYKNYDVLSVHFSNLDQIRLFRDYLFTNYELTIDMARVEAMENYNFVTKITRIISLLLIGFSILSICLFVGNLLSKHLERIHMNIGTFKAFGIDNSTLKRIYLLLVYLFIIISIVISMIIAWLFEISGSAKLILSFFSLKLEENQSYFKLFDLWTLIAIILTLSISYFVLSMHAKRILNKTPGDLIYSRL